MNKKRREVQLAGLKTSPTVAEAKAESDPAFEQECVALFASFLHVLGAPNSVGAIYGLLFASPEPLCFAEIVAKLGMSKGSVSQGLAFLRQSGAVKTVNRGPMDGGRREYFEPELGLRRLASGLIKEKIQPLAKETKGAVARLKQHAQNSRGGRSDFQMDRIKQLEIWHKQLGRVLPVVRTMLNIPRQ
ncbi:GbsR/MarR family transcriptional regulator [Oleiharenicola lentus]|uniref:GbsR/MarR family transcriptional regulator n=1 Tax=Oleiharenicola lentus TaxID=2508720 RepID=UPI0013E8FA65|nr:ArsR family transcriptional regulator [Oleiharenicola lentus]